jgi:hypothetical protein
VFCFCAREREFGDATGYANASGDSVACLQFGLRHCARFCCIVCTTCLPPPLFCCGCRRCVFLRRHCVFLCRCCLRTGTFCCPILSSRSIITFWCRRVFVLVRRRNHTATAARVLRSVFRMITAREVKSRSTLLDHTHAGFKQTSVCDLVNSSWSVSVGSS